MGNRGVVLAQHRAVFQLAQRDHRADQPHPNRLLLLAHEPALPGQISSGTRLCPLATSSWLSV